MIRLTVLAITLLAASCGPVPNARMPAYAGATAGNGGGEAVVGIVPPGTTTFPYRK